ncbi:hypothetical protein [Amycolatopsis albispora]|uniref:Uncharacterized protein n=1 Tax=Amycolatopsis albispora TaxID=1804986 RepID=A0A344LCW9_9PSEU|nr:hypothetical protein [Amycolatopsis albispora]AXB45893.1 hypothetical protein A4R43_28260 [Amycolatopsis albispora]
MGLPDGITVDHFHTGASLLDCAEESVLRLRTAALFVGVTRRDELSGAQGTGLVQTLRLVKWPHRLFRAEAYFRLKPGGVLRVVGDAPEDREAEMRAELADFLTGLQVTR